ncbi:hypothetical protein AGIG_G7193 [Arapaima gigas]
MISCPAGHPLWHFHEVHGHGTVYYTKWPETYAVQELLGDFFLVELGVTRMDSEAEWKSREAGVADGAGAASGTVSRTELVKAGFRAGRSEGTPATFSFGETYTFYRRAT